MAPKKSWKLTPRQRLIVIDRYRNGDLLKVIAHDYGVTAIAIGQMAHRSGEPLRKMSKERIK